MKINCIAIDDEPLALDVIEHHVNKIPFINLKAKISNAFDAIDYLCNNQVDLIFLDIQMPDLTGFELLNSLNKKPLVIFTTAYPNFALESYEMNAVDYLVKPIPFDRILKAVNKVKERFNVTQVPIIDSQAQSSIPDYIFVKTEYKTIKIFLSEILYIESQKDYVTFHLNSEKVMSLLSIKSVEAFLPQDQFIRVHRSFIIAINKIDAIERNNILIQKNNIPVGDNYKEAFKVLIDCKKI
jgi:DNA-binding LytR/AlgR family response regulator